MGAQRKLRSAWASAESGQSSLSARRSTGSLTTHEGHREGSEQTGRMNESLLKGQVILSVLSCCGSYPDEIKKNIYGPRQANLVLVAYSSSEGSDEPAHPRSLARTSAASSYKQ